jgi:hypothetical protein
LADRSADVSVDDFSADPSADRSIDAAVGGGQSLRITRGPASAGRDFQHRLFPIVPAARADAMRDLGVAALGARLYSDGLGFEVRAALSLTLLRYSLLRNCHVSPVL